MCGPIPAAPDFDLSEFIRNLPKRTEPDTNIKDRHVRIADVERTQGCCIAKKQFKPAPSGCEGDLSWQEPLAAFWERRYGRSLAEADRLGL